MINIHELSNGRNIKILKRAPNDEFTFSLFVELLESLDCEFEAYYVWSNPPAIFEKLLNRRPFRKPNIVIGIKDLLDLWVDSDYWRGGNTVTGIDLLDKTCQRYPDKNFIIFTSLENIDREPLTANNIKFVQWGGDITNQANVYATLPPVLNKNFESEKTFISLNRNWRNHRLMCLGYLFGQGYDQYGQLTLLSQKIKSGHSDDLLSFMPWVFAPHHDLARQKMIDGYKILYHNTELYADDFEIYPHSHNDNISNFNNKLRVRYQNSFVEIVSETTFAPRSFLITEKTAHAIYGCNFPILMSGVGAVAHLRDLGIDVFDDVVDHSYDTVDNPIDRIIAAIDGNKHLLTDAAYVKKLWQENQHRFEKNVKTLSTGMLDWYRCRAQQQFRQLKWLANSGQ